MRTTGLLVLFTACARPASTGAPAQPVEEGPCAASLAAAGVCTGATSDLQMCSVFATTVVLSEITNNTTDDLVFSSGFVIAGWRGEMLHGPTLGPVVGVAAGSTGRPWTIALPALPDGYARVSIMVSAPRPGTTRDRATESEVLLRVTGGVVATVEPLDWPVLVTAAAPGAEAEAEPAGPTPRGLLHELLVAEVGRRSTPREDAPVPGPGR